jgi:DNA helicase-2/ATP-dependent DNA helicase PcrA
MFDSDLKIDDEILQEILSKSTDSKMKTIITSIQREQNRAIRDENHRILFVQGPAGSGKTSIAMHRAAYLLYRDRNTITANNILVFSPNRIFSDYISGVLPELGEENVRQTIFQDYLIRNLAQLPFNIEERDEQLEYLYQRKNQTDYTVRTASIRYKSSEAFTRVITNYIRVIQDRIQNYPDIVFEGETIFTQSEWSTLFGQTLSYLSISRRLAQLKKMIQIRLRPIIHRLRSEEVEKIAATGEEVNERVIKALARIAVKEKMAAFIGEITERTIVDPLILYRRLFEDQTLLQRLAGGDPMPAEWPAICRLTLTGLEQGRIFYEDSLPLLYFQGCLNGFPTKSGIRHLVLDEAQD